MEKLLVYSLLIAFASSSFLPMSQKKHNFGDNICHYYERNEQINYVRPCNSGEYCQDTESNNDFGATNVNNLYTCQKDIYIPPNPVTPTSLKDRGESCENSGECKLGLSCITTGSDTQTKCNLNCGTGQEVHLIGGSYECRYTEFKDKCTYIRNGNSGSYSRRNTCKVCGLITFGTETDSDRKEFKVINTIDENDYYSQPDGTFVSEQNACKSGTALLFYGDGGIKNEVNSGSRSSNNLHYRCVTIKAVDHRNKRLNYTIGSGNIQIYEANVVSQNAINTVDQDKISDLINTIDEFLMTKIELMNDYIEYEKKNAGCSQNNNIDDDLYRKVYYYNHPQIYLLYKDQTEVIEYLIQKDYRFIVPIIKAKEDGTTFLKSKYMLLALILLAF